jgi:hypothetical protein
MKLVYNRSGINQARDALRAMQRTIKYRSYTTGEKLNLLQRFDALVEEENVTQNVASTMLGVSLSCVLAWRSKKEALSAAVTKDKLSLHKGPASILQEVEQELVEYIHLWRQKGFPVSRMGIVRKVGQLRPEFGEKSLAARQMVVSRFLARNHLTHPHSHPIISEGDIAQWGITAN